MRLTTDRAREILNNLCIERGIKAILPLLIGNSFAGHWDEIKCFSEEQFVHFIEILLVGLMSNGIQLMTMIGEGQITCMMYVPVDILVANSKAVRNAINRVAQGTDKELETFKRLMLTLDQPEDN